MLFTIPESPRTTVHAPASIQCNVDKIMPWQSDLTSAPLAYASDKRLRTTPLTIPTVVDLAFSSLSLKIDLMRHPRLQTKTAIRSPPHSPHQVSSLRTSYLQSSAYSTPPASKPTLVSSFPYQTQKRLVFKTALQLLAPCWNPWPTTTRSRRQRNTPSTNSHIYLYFFSISTTLSLAALEHIGKKNKSKESDKEKYRSRIGTMVGLGCQLRHSHIQLLSRLLAWLFSLAIALSLLRVPAGWAYIRAALIIALSVQLAGRMEVIDWHMGGRLIESSVVAISVLRSAISFPVFIW